MGNQHVATGESSYKAHEQVSFLLTRADIPEASSPVVGEGFLLNDGRPAAMAAAPQGVLSGPLCRDNAPIYCRHGIRKGDFDE